MIVPTIIEKTEGAMVGYDIFSRLLKDRIIFIGTGINDDVSNLIIAQLLFLQAEDPDVLTGLIDLFGKQTPKSIRKMRAALSKKKRKVLEDEAHSLKSSCGNLGAHIMVELCEKIEEVSAKGSFTEMRKLINELELEFQAVRANLKKEIRKGTQNVSQAA